MISTCITAVSVPLHLLAEKRDGPAAVRTATKALASLGFVGAAVAAGAGGSPFGRLILTGLVLSLAGDLFLLSRARKQFLAGIAGFLLAQLAYVTAFLVHGADALILAGSAVAVLITGICVFRWLEPHIPRDMLGPVIAYIVVISAMVAAAFGAAGQSAPFRLPLGAALFYISDLAVARDRFIKKDFRNRVAGLPLYYAGQLLIASCAGI